MALDVSRPAHRLWLLGAALLVRVAVGDIRKESTCRSLR